MDLEEQFAALVIGLQEVNRSLEVLEVYEGFYKNKIKEALELKRDILDQLIELQKGIGK